MKGGMTFRVALLICFCLLCLVWMGIFPPVLSCIKCAVLVTGEGHHKLLSKKHANRPDILFIYLVHTHGVFNVF